MKRTGKQNNAIHLYCRMLADTLNDAGLDVQTTLSKPLEMPWNEKLAKELIWRKVQVPMTGKHSTKDLDRIEVDKVYQVIARHLAQAHGISVPFPSEEESP